MTSGTDIIAAAERYTGVPYSQHNPQSPSTGLDCSGLVQLALSNLGISTPRTTESQLAAAIAGTSGHDIGTNLSNAQPGDVIHYFGHEEIYLGGGKVFSEATTGTTAGIRGVGGPGPITGIVRYSDGTSGSTTASLAASTTFNPLDPGSWVSGITNWADSIAVKVGLTLLGGCFLLLGLIMTFKNTNVTQAMKVVTK